MKEGVWNSLLTVPSLGGGHNQAHRHSASSHNYLIDIDSGSNVRGHGDMSSPDSSPSNESSNSQEGIRVDDPEDPDPDDLKGNMGRETFLGGEGVKKRGKKQNTNRLVRKSGGVNVKVVNVEDKGERYVGDFFTTLVDVRWRWTLVYFTLSYVLSWFFFAILWWIIVRGHGDMDHFEEEDWSPCVVGVNSFSSIFLFSVETQHTIGYGYHRMSDECMEAIVLLVVQTIIGVIIESLTVGVFIVKLSRSKKRAQTVIFSKFAVICRKDDGLFFMFRVADVGKSMLLEAHMRAQLIMKTVGKSGKVLICQQSMTLEADDQDEDRLLLFWPTTISHEIDQDSPMFTMTPESFKKSWDNKFEIIVVLEGIVESTGMTTQARTSYLPSEILWGHKFLDLIHEGAKYTADMELFHTTFPLPEMTAHSAKEWKEMELSTSENSTT